MLLAQQLICCWALVLLSLSCFPVTTGFAPLLACSWHVHLQMRADTALMIRCSTQFIESPQSLTFS